VIRNLKIETDLCELSGQNIYTLAVAGSGWVFGSDCYHFAGEVYDRLLFSTNNIQDSLSIRVTHLLPRSAADAKPNVRSNGALSGTKSRRQHSPLTDRRLVTTAPTAP
jgi:hypothetical protein